MYVLELLVSRTTYVSKPRAQLYTKLVKLELDNWAWLESNIPTSMVVLYFKVTKSSRKAIGTFNRTIEHLCLQEKQ